MKPNPRRRKCEMIYRIQKINENKYLSIRYFIYCALNIDKSGYCDSEARF